MWPEEKKILFSIAAEVSDNRDCVCISIEYSGKAADAFPTAGVSAAL